MSNNNHDNDVFIIKFQSDNDTIRQFISVVIIIIMVVVI